jgi:LPS-assembly lipoprotein
MLSGLFNRRRPRAKESSVRDALDTLKGVPSSSPRKRGSSAFTTRRPKQSAYHAGRRFAILALPALLITSCGFRLRGEASYRFNSIYVNAPTSPPFAAELRRALAGSGGAKLAENPSSAEVVLDVSTVTDDKSVLSLSSGGRVREFALAKRIVFRVHDKDGRDWLPSGEIVVRRTYLYDDTERLAREIQEGRLLREMQSDAIAQIVRQLQMAKAPV